MNTNTRVPVTAGPDDRFHEVVLSVDATGHVSADFTEDPADRAMSDAEKDAASKQAFIDRAIEIAEAMMHASWATGRDSDWHPLRHALRVHLEQGLGVDAAAEDGSFLPSA